MMPEGKASCGGPSQAQSQQNLMLRSFSSNQYWAHAVGAAVFAQSALYVYVGLPLSFMPGVLNSVITLFSTGL